MQRQRRKIHRPVGPLLTAAFLFASAQAWTEVAPSLDAGMTQLAVDIVAKSKEKDRHKIAVLPFPNTDGSCSVLSNFLVDKLITSLFQVPDSGQTIVERSQLEALLSELEMGETGLLDASTTQKLGSIHGVQALVLGSITPSTNQIEVSARLVATDTGAVFAAASTSFPRTSDISEWLRQPVTTGPGCGAKAKRPAGSERGAITAPGKTPDVANTGNVQTFTAENILFEFKSVHAEGKTATIVMAVVNTSDKPVPFMLTAIEKGNRRSLLRAIGNQWDLEKVKGVFWCRASGNWCLLNQQADYVILKPNVPKIVTMLFTGNTTLSESEYWFEAGAQILRDGSPTDITISLPDLAVTP